MEPNTSKRAARRLAARLTLTTHWSRRGLLRASAGAFTALLATRLGESSNLVGVASAEPIDYTWLAAKQGTPLRLDGDDVRWLRPGTLLRVARGARGPRLWAWCPAFATFGTVDAAALVESSAPTESELLAERTGPILPTSLELRDVPGRVVGGANLRFWPREGRDTLIRALPHNAEVRVVEVVEGDDGDPWYRVTESAFGPNPPLHAAFFVHSNFVRLPNMNHHPTPRNPDRVPPKWFEADLESPAMLTAYEAGRPVWSSLALHGRSETDTPRGDRRVLLRVARETMTSERVYPPIPRDAPGGYYLENVLYTQYFDRTGAAIHYNYWASNWGYRGTHGCLGLPLNESKFCWDWARTGTPVRIFG